MFKCLCVLIGNYLVVYFFQVFLHYTVDPHEITSKLVFILSLNFVFFSRIHICIIDLFYMRFKFSISQKNYIRKKSTIEFLFKSNTKVFYYPHGSYSLPNFICYLYLYFCMY